MSELQDKWDVHLIDCWHKGKGSKMWLAIKMFKLDNPDADVSTLKRFPHMSWLQNQDVFGFIAQQLRPVSTWLLAGKDPRTMMKKLDCNFSATDRKYLQRARNVAVTGKVAAQANTIGALHHFKSDKHNWKECK